MVKYSLSSPERPSFLPSSATFVCILSTRYYSITMTLQGIDNSLDRRLEQIHLAAPSSIPAFSDETDTGMDSSNTLIAKPSRNLVELPKEVIENILTHVFAHHDQVLNYDNEEADGLVTINGGLPTAMPMYNLGDRSDNIEEDFRMPYYTSLSTSCHLGLPAGTLNVLQTCGLLYVIGARTFYGMYEFRTTSAESFRLLFTKHIGPSNLKSIRRLSIGLPHAVKTMPTKFINRYTRMLETQMPQLKHFEITTKFGRWYNPVTANPGSTWVENHRGLLWFSAWVTRSHPVLKCAVWDEEGTVSNNKVDSERAGYYDRREVVITVALMGTKPADIQTMEDPKDIEARNDLLPMVLVDDYDSEDDPEDLWTPTAHEEYAEFDDITGERIKAEEVKPASRLLLDSWKIRRTGFVALSKHENCRPYRYQLPLTAVNSEAHTPTYDAMNDDILCEERFFHRTTALLPK